jgi:hypothetical protein
MPVQPAQPTDPVDATATFINDLQSALDTFKPHITSLSSGQKKMFLTYFKLLKEAQGVVEGSNTCRNNKQRARNAVQTIFFSEALGPQVSLLCTIAVSCTKLRKNWSRLRLLDVETWWKNAPRPESLETLTGELAEPLRELMTDREDQSTEDLTAGAQDAEPLEEAASDQDANAEPHEGVQDVEGFENLQAQSSATGKEKNPQGAIVVDSAQVLLLQKHTC